jgi:DnaJ-class molecular chaperone
VKKSLDSIRTISEDWKRIDAYHEWMKGLELEIFSLKAKVEKLTCAQQPNGAEPLEICPECHGCGEVSDTKADYGQKTCSRCHGTGKLHH